MTEVISHKIRVGEVGGFPGVPLESLPEPIVNDERVKNGDPIWIVDLTTRTGLDKENHSLTVFMREEDAQYSVSSLPVGTIYGEEPRLLMRFKEMCERTESNGKPAVPAELIFKAFVSLADDVVLLRCYEALAGAGVISKTTFEISELVLDFLGSENVLWMKENFGENWFAIGQLEYCLAHFPQSSLATISAKLMAAYFVFEDDFSVGYLTKELEVISGGTEGAATKFTETHKKAGEAGARSSTERKAANLEILMREIEALESAADLVSEARILAQAKERALDRNPNFPKSKSTLEGYETILRSEPAFKSRYDAVFRKNA